MRNQWIILAVVIVVLAIIGGAIVLPHLLSKKSVGNMGTATIDPFNTSYSIDGTSIALVNGSAEQAAAPSSASRIVTKIFGQPTVGDINNDGKPDAAIILTQSGGGSGTFYYAAAVLGGDVSGIGDTAPGTNAILLGDRTAPDTMQIANGIVTVNYADRAAGEPMTASPSVGVSKYLVVAGGELYDVPITVAYPLAPGITWGDMKAATVVPGDANVPSALAGIEIVSQPIVNITNLSAPSLPFESYYKKKLTTAGWTVDNALAAGGPGASVIGYKKGNDFIVLQYASVFKNNGGGTGPETCPCDMTFSIFAGVLE